MNISDQIDKLYSVFHSYFPEDPAVMILDGLESDIQDAADFLIGVSFGYQFYDFHFPFSNSLF